MAESAARSTRIFHWSAVVDFCRSFSCCGCRGWVDPDRLGKGAGLWDPSNEAFRVAGPGGALDGAAGARESASDDGRRLPATPPALGTPAPRRAARQAVGLPSAARSVFEVQSQQPGNSSLYVQDRVRGVQLVLQASHFRLERAHLRIQRVAFARLCAALLRGQLPKRTLAPRLAPSRQMGAVQPLAAKQPTHLAGLRTALRLLEDPQPILRGELAPLRPGHDLRARGRSCAPGPGGVGCAGESIFTTTTVIIPITAAPPCPPERTAPAQLSDDDGSM